MNRIRGKAYVIRYNGKDRHVNGRRLVYGYDMENRPRENAYRGWIEIGHTFPKDRGLFSMHETRIKANDILAPYKNENGKLCYS